MSNTALESGLAALKFSRNNTLAFFEDIPADQLCHSPVSGGNHALWILGHLAQTDDFFLNALGGEPAALPEEYASLFGMGSTPVTDPSAYPSVDDIKTAMAAQRERMVSWFSGMSAERLDAPLQGDFSRFATSHANLMSSLAWHEGLHAGQLTMIRRSVKLAPKFG
jgi:uncharacterized damage-inducible protein DinB